MPLFGDKTTLFREAVAAYTSRRAKKYAAALALPTAREVVDAWLRLTGGVEGLEGSPAGCLLVHGAMGGDAETTLLGKELANIRREGTTLLAKRFERAKRERDLPSSINPNVLAEGVASLSTGMAIQSANGTRSELLTQVIDLVMATWPGKR